MSTLLALISREWRAFWYSPIAYIVGAFFLILQGFVFWLLVRVLNDPRVDPTWRMSQFFFGGTFFFWLSLMIMAPLLTMRTFSEEKRIGTIEMLLSSPVADWQVVLSKFLGAWLSFCALWAFTGIYFLMLRRYTALDWGPILTGYLGTWLVGGAFVAIGVFTSSLTRNQVIAAFMGLVIMILLFSLGLLGIFTTDPQQSQWIRYLSLAEHFRDFSRGILDTRPIVYYVSIASIALFLTARAIGNPRWRA